MIKIVGLILMLFDHSSKFLFPSFYPSVFQGLGSLSFPLFAYSLCIGFSKTKNYTFYLINLILFSLLSQSVYSSLVFGYNVLFTLLLGLIFLYLASLYGSFVYFFIIPFVLYGIASPEILLVFLIYHLIEKPMLLTLSFCLFFLVLSFLLNNYVYLFACISPLFFYIDFPRLKIPKYFFYFFYPLHLYAIYFLRGFL